MDINGTRLILAAVESVGLTGRPTLHLNNAVTTCKVALSHLAEDINSVGVYIVPAGDPESLTMFILLGNEWDCDVLTSEG